MMSDPIVRVQADMPDAVVRIEVANQGKDGYTPKRGVDYWTEEDVQEIHDYVDEQIGAGGGGSGAVNSVNGKTGAVVLAPEDIGAQPKGDYALKEEVPQIDDTLAQSGNVADAKVVGDKFVELSEEIAGITEEFVGKNLFNPNDSDVVSGYVNKSNGNIMPHSTYYASGFIPIKSGAIYAFCGGGVTHNAIYNSDKTYNSQPTVTSVSGWVTFTSSVDGYLRFTINNANAIATAMVIEVESLAELAEYKPSNYIPYYTYKLPVGVAELRTKIRENIYIYASDGIGNFYSKMSAAYESGNCDVYIGKGDYIYTNDLIDTIRAENKRGVPIGNGCRYFFESGAKLHCEYTGDNADDVVNFFSPLDSQNVGGDYEIYNLDLTAKNVCYAIHDEANGAEEFCKHVYKNCWVELDNSALGGSGNSISKALGGGLGQHTEIIIENCVFKATNPANTSSTLNVASYHGANSSAFTDAKIVVAGCYFDGGNFRTSDLSVNTESPYPRVIYTGNSSKGAVNLAGTWDVKAWNNEFRS